MPPGNERRPGGETEATRTASAGSGNTSIPAGTVGQADVEPRAGGTVRVTFEREASGTCLVCGATFTSTGAGASHARATRHTVTCTYAARFSFIAVESLDGAK